MSETGVAYACRLLVAGLDALAEATGPSATDDELVSALAVYEGVTRRVDCGVAGVVADLDRRGTLTERGYRNTVTAIADLLSLGPGRRHEPSTCGCHRAAVGHPRGPPVVAAGLGGRGNPTGRLFRRVHPSELLDWGTRLIDTLDQDGPEPDDEPA